MSVENGEWIMYGVDKDDPFCIHTVAELEKCIEEIGFLPLFRNEIPGFSVEERTVVDYWWSGDAARDPWEWREIVARNRKIAYGKFFNGKAGFISREWIPYFANFKRDGYDFDSLWEDGKANMRQKKVMDFFDEDSEIMSHELKAKAGFGKGGEKNFDGTITGLQMQMYLVMCDFRQKVNKKGEAYGWPIAVYCMPEHLYGYDLVSRAYKESPKQSGNRIYNYIKERYPIAADNQIKKVLGVVKQ
ncbi:MAG: hypothetical protein MJ124_08725 [Lachnospiraceae bacterium]|nr:hypothetical protein [Lachnospiraceae bacterium]